jgi:hypothetical protein
MATDFLKVSTVNMFGYDDNAEDDGVIDPGALPEEEETEDDAGVGADNNEDDPEVDAM